jgi:hypothetical protein
MAKSGSLTPLNTNPASNPNSMKTAQTKRNRFVSYLRFTASSAFFAAAAAFALVAATTNLQTTHNVATTKKGVSIKSLVKDSVSNPAKEISDKAGSKETPATAALEEAMKRAYPGTETPFTAQMNAIIGLKRFVATSGSAATPTPTPGKGKPTKKSKKSPPEKPRFNTWFAAGPFTEVDPNVLTFTGSTQTISGRITALVLDTASGCTPSFCRLWVGAAGGGVWRTTNALASTPTWTFLTSLNFSTNAIGTLTYIPSTCIPACGGIFNPNFPDGILYAGTGEPNASADSEAGLGIFISYNGGDTWTQLPSQIGPITTNNGPGGPSNGTYTGNAFFGRSISGIAVNPTNFNILYVSTARGVRGVGSTGGATSTPPAPRPPFGLFKSTDGGQHFSYIFDGGATCPAGCTDSDPTSTGRGVHEVALDPTNPNIVYAAPFNGGAGSGGVWRSSDGGVTWTQIKPALNATVAGFVDRCSFSVTTIAGPNTRMYVGCGNDGTNTAQVYRSDAVQTGAPAFTNLTALEVVPSTSGYCGGQCWYDNVIYTPPGSPDIIYVGGSYVYNECAEGSDCRGVVFATDAGASGNLWSDATWDAQNNGGVPDGTCCQPNTVAPNGLHPDQHAIVTVPGNPFQFFEGSDGGLTRSNGTLSDISAQCAARTYPAGTGTLLQCQLLLGAGCGPSQCGVPTLITSLNSGLNTLQFQSVVVASDNPFHLQGGTQDNGTMETYGSFTWNEIMFGDGGQSGFSVTNSNLRFNTFTFQQSAASFFNGDPTRWDIISFPMLASPEGSLFYPPVVADPHAAFAQTIFHGDFHVWRTQDWGLSPYATPAQLDANCNVFPAFIFPPCGDFVTLGGAPGGNDQGCLTCPFYAGRAGGDVGQIARTTANTGTAWASTSTGRLFISENVNAAAGSVIWNRLDANGANHDPGRFITDIAIDPVNPRHAWVAYSGYNFNTPSQPGHIFSVTWDGVNPATFTNITNNLPDIPITSVVLDPVTGDLYLGSDFIVFRKAANQQNNQQVWDVAGMGFPLVEVPKLTINPSAGFLYAATHGLGAWILPLYGR